jgi:hypothetical protein
VEKILDFPKEAMKILQNIIVALFEVREATKGKSLN